jgi:hypothetical protein
VHGQSFWTEFGLPDTFYNATFQEKKRHQERGYANNLCQHERCCYYSVLGAFKRTENGIPIFSTGLFLHMCPWLYVVAFYP